MESCNFKEEKYTKESCNFRVILMLSNLYNEFIQIVIASRKIFVYVQIFTRWTWINIKLYYCYHINRSNEISDWLMYIFSKKNLKIRFFPHFIFILPENGFHCCACDSWLLCDEFGAPLIANDVHRSTISCAIFMSSSFNLATSGGSGNK